MPKKYFTAGFSILLVFAGFLFLDAGEMRRPDDLLYSPGKICQPGTGEPDCRVTGLKSEGLWRMSLLMPYDEERLGVKLLYSFTRFVLRDGEAFVFMGTKPGDKKARLCSYSDGVLKLLELEDGKKINVYQADRKFILNDSVLLSECRERVVYEIDENGIRKIISKGDELLIAGEKRPIKKVKAVWAKSGKAVFSYVAKGDYRGWLIYDGSELKPFLSVGDRLHGESPFHVKGLSDFVVLTGDGDTALAILEVSDAPFEKALFRITPEGTEKIIAKGDPVPGSPEHHVTDLSLLKVANAERFSIAISTDQNTMSDPRILVHDCGEWTEMMDLYRWKDLIKADKVAWWGGFLPGEQLGYVLVTFGATKGERHTSYPSLYKIVQTTEWKITTSLIAWSNGKLYLFHGLDIPVNNLYRIIDGAYRGLVVLLDATFRDPWRLATFGSYRNSKGALFLSADSIKDGLKHSPELLTESGERISLRQVFYWSSRDEARAELGDGIYRLTRVTENKQ
jgi:hypothetical protein